MSTTAVDEPEVLRPDVLDAFDALIVLERADGAPPLPDTDPPVVIVVTALVMLVLTALTAPVVPAPTLGATVVCSHEYPPYPRCTRSKRCCRPRAQPHRRKHLRKDHIYASLLLHISPVHLSARQTQGN